MDVKAILLVGGRPHDNQSEKIGNVPIALLDVLGEPVIQRVIERITHLGVTAITVVSETDDSVAPGLRNRLRPDIRWVNVKPGEVWRSAEQQFNDFAQNGAELVLIARVGPYLDLDYEEFVQFHLDCGARVSGVSDMIDEPLDCFLVTASRRNDAAHLLRSEFRETRSECHQFKFGGYFNRLKTAADLRALAMAAFAQECSIRPGGTQIRPGVWVEESARLHRRARVLAPAYIGRHSRIRASAVITRGSIVEHHSVIDCGTVVENSTVLPFSSVGAGLDVTHSVVGSRQISHLLRNVTVDIHDDRFLSTTPVNAPVRALGSAFDLLAYVPKTFINGFRRKPAACASDEIPEAVNAMPPALEAPADNQPDHKSVPAFPANLMTVRRYGNE